MVANTQHILQILLVFIITTDSKSQAYQIPDRPEWPYPRPTSRNNEGCGNITSFGGTSGRITSPHYPDSIGPSLACFYTIEVAEKNSVNITFESFLTDEYIDWVQIRCSNGTNKYESPRYFGGNIPPFMSFRSCRQIGIEFHSDYWRSINGFSLNYSVGEAALSGGIISAPKNVYTYNKVPRQIVLSCESSIPTTGSYPWWTYADGHEHRLLTNSACEFVNFYGGNGFMLVSTSKWRGPSSSVCNITLSVQPNYWETLWMFTCTDSSLSTSSALVARFSSYSVSTDNEKEIVKGDNVTVTCTHPPLTAGSPINPINVSTSFSSAEQDFIPNAADSDSYSSKIIVEASSEVLPSYACHFSFFIVNSSVAMATNLPEGFTLNTNQQEVLFWPESDAMTIIGTLDGKMEQDGVLTCHVPANPTPKYHWVDAASGISSAGPTVHVLHSGDYTCFATSLIRHRIYNASKSVTIEIVGPGAVRGKGSSSTVAVVFGVIGLLFFGIYAAVLVLLYRKVMSLNGYVSQSVSMDGVFRRRPKTNDNCGNTYYDDQYKTVLVTE